MSQTQLAREIGLTPAAVWNWETRGRTPRPQILAKVAEALNVSKQFLAEGRDGAEPSRSGTTKEEIELAPAGVSPAQGPEQGVRLAEVVETTRKRIAELTGFGPDQLKLTLTIDGLDATAAGNLAAKKEKHP